MAYKVTVKMSQIMPEQDKPRGQAFESEVIMHYRVPADQDINLSMAEDETASGQALAAIHAFAEVDPDGSASIVCPASSVEQVKALVQQFATGKFGANTQMAWAGAKLLAIEPGNGNPGE